MWMRSICVWAIAGLVWVAAAHAGELDETVLASFLPEPLPGFVTDSMEFDRPDQGLWAGYVYRGDDWTFLLSFTVDAAEATKIRALIDGMSNSEQSIQTVQVANVDFSVIVGECFAVLPGDVVVYCTSFGEFVAMHLETVDFAALSEAALN